MSRVWAAWPRWRDSPVRDAVLAVVVTAVIVAGAYGEAHPTRVSDEVISGHPVPRELRAILNVLRQADEADPTQPAPGLSQVDALIASAARAGLPTSLRRTGPPRPLPSEVDVAAYRIIRESLTNAIRHAGPAAATVWLAYDEAGLRVEVADTGRGVAAAAGTPPGHGLIGMRERAAAAGGTLETGPGPDGGFRVAARFPAVAPAAGEPTPADPATGAG
ncbi:MAG: sensor histidine kinase, partial [Streptosporangiaceae bacterium]